MRVSLYTQHDADSKDEMLQLPRTYFLVVSVQGTIRR